MNIEHATSDAAIRASYRAIAELRPHLSEEAFVAQVKRQMANHGYRLVTLSEEGEVVAAAGYRVAEFLAWGKVFYLDDLITVTTARCKGYGGQLLDWLINEARTLGCQQFHLDSGSQRHEAHRLYMSRKLSISSFHFSQPLK